MSLYGEYIKERLGDDIVESPEGFATYRFHDKDTVYLIDIYVIPERRKTGAAKEMADYIAKIAKERGCTKMLGTVVPSARGSTDSIKALLAYGMKLDSSTTDFILFRKDL